MNVFAVDAGLTPLRNKLENIVPQIAQILGLRNIPIVFLISEGRSVYQTSVNIITISTKECEQVLPKIRYFQRKRYELSAYDFDWIVYALAHEMSHAYQIETGLLKKPNNMSFSWKGGDSYHPIQYVNKSRVGHQCDPCEIDANRRATKIIKELWKLNKT
jgi:hypothetical protein